MDGKNKKRRKKIIDGKKGWKVESREKGTEGKEMRDLKGEE